MKKRPAWLKKGARVVYLDYWTVVGFVGMSHAIVKSNVGYLEWWPISQIGVTWHRAPAKKARKR